MSDTYAVQRSISIQASPADVYAHIIDFHHWGNWSPWEELDPSMTKSYSGPDSGVGAKYSWTGNRKVGEGNMEITGAAEPTRVEIALEFLKPFKASNNTVFTLQPAGDGTEVIWVMTGRKTLMTRIMGVFKSMDSMVGPDFERGLSRLKAAAEAD